MYSLLDVKYPNIESIRQQFKVLQNARVKGWIMIRAYHIIHSNDVIHSHKSQ